MTTNQNPEPGDIFQAEMERTQGKARIASYKVLTIYANGTVYAVNVKTGKERSFPNGIPQ